MRPFRVSVFPVTLAIGLGRITGRTSSGILLQQMLTFRTARRTRVDNDVLSRHDRRPKDSTKRIMNVYVYLLVLPVYFLVVTHATHLLQSGPWSSQSSQHCIHRTSSDVQNQYMQCGIHCPCEPQQPRAHHLRTLDVLLVSTSWVP